MPALARIQFFKDDPSFRRIWLSGLINGFVRWVDTLVVGIYTYETTGSAFYVALVTFIRLAPLVLLGSVVGVLAERADGRSLLGSALLTSSFLFFVIGYLSITHGVSIQLVFLNCFVIGVVWVIEMPVRRTAVLHVVGESHIGRAMLIESASNNFSRMTGPVLGGILYTQAGLSGVFALGGLLSVISLVLTMTINRTTRPVAGNVSSGLLYDFTDLLRIIKSSRVIVSILLCTVLLNFFGFSYASMIPVIGVDRLDLSATLIGMLMSAEGAGAFAGAIWFALFGRLQNLFRIFFLGGVVYLGCVLTFSASTIFLIALPVVFLAGIGMSSFGSMQSALLLTQTPDGYRNRIMGLLAVCIGFGPLGTLCLGWATDYLTPHVAIALFSATGLAAFLFIYLAWEEVQYEISR